MATGPELLSSALQTISENHLQCVFCLERYKHPKILDCLHSFCEHCLDEYYDTKYKDATEIPCPVCRREMQLPQTGIQGLKTSFYLIALIDEVALQEKVVSSGTAKLSCEFCNEDVEATHRCLDCACNICSNCCRIHPRIPSLSKHTIATLEDIRQEKVTLKKIAQDVGPRCPKHKGEVLRFYCETCQVLICRDCTVVDHCKPEHQYIDSAEASLKYKKAMKDILPVCHTEIKELEESLAAASQAKQEFRDKVITTMKDVKETADQIRAKVTAEENKMIDAIKTLEQDRMAAFDEHEKAVGMMLQRKQHSLDTANDVTNTATDSDFLSLYPIISNELRSLTSHRPPVIDRRLSCLHLNKSQRVGDISLGKLVWEGKWELHHTFGKKGRGLGEFNCAWGIAALQPNKIAVADTDNHRVVIYSIEGQHERIIQNLKSDCPIAIASINNQFMVVDNTNGVIEMYKEDGFLAFQFTTLPLNEVGTFKTDLWSIAAKKNGHILVGDAQRKVVTVHRPTDGGILSTMPVTTTPRFLAVDCNDRVVISGDDEKQVAVIDDNGTTLLTIKPTVDGQQVGCCQGVCCDGSDIYIAMVNGNDTGHIHHYDSHGTFIKCIAKGLHDPLGITFTSDSKQLLVANRYSVKIYHFV